MDDKQNDDEPQGDCTVDHCIIDSYSEVHSKHNARLGSGQVLNIFRNYFLVDIFQFFKNNTSEPNGGRTRRRKEIYDGEYGNDIVRTYSLHRQ